MRFKGFLILLLFSFLGFSQVETEKNPPSHIKSIIFKSTSSDDQFPIVKLGQSTLLKFDDLNANEADYYYKIIHCNYDWTPSNLLKSEYLNGLDNQRIITYENSFNTLQSYSHYQLKIPNQLTKIRLSGNYILKIYDNSDELVFSRRFLVYENSVSVGAKVKRTRDLNYINTHQTLQFKIIPNQLQLINPKQEVKVVLLQNYRWETAKFDVVPQYTIGNELIYNYDDETRFKGGNEFLNFDSKNLLGGNISIQKVTKKNLYHHYLYTNINRSTEPYTYFPDINGDFAINIDSNQNNNTEADYIQTHFSIPYQSEYGFNTIYVVGRFNNYQLTEENKLTFNEKTSLMEGSFSIKQGFYNYKYVAVDDKNNIDYNLISGNFYQTENQYLILVYFKKFGKLYDSLIGIGNVSSINISDQ